MVWHLVWHWAMLDRAGANDTYRVALVGVTEVMHVTVPVAGGMDTQVSEILSYI
jgi:hypothetical protein